MSAGALLPPAPWRQVLRGRAPLIGSRLDPAAPRGRFSPAEARVLFGLAYDDARTEERARLTARSPLADLRTIASSVVARAMAPRGAEVARPFIVSAPVDNVDAASAIAAICAPPRGDRARRVAFVHPHALNLARRDPRLARHLATADLVLPDGSGTRLAARMLGVQLRHNLNGTDLLPRLCAAAIGVTPLVLIGAAPGVADTCAARLRAAHPGLDIPIVASGFLTPGQIAALREQLAALPRAIVLVGMGTPIQEAFVDAHLADLGHVTTLTVGGLFDFYAERIPRAPVWLREVGLEWTWRLAQEPRRMWRRYLVGNVSFVAAVARQRRQARAP